MSRTVDPRRGRLLIIGGAAGPALLGRFVELAGGPRRESW